MQLAPHNGINRTISIGISEIINQVIFIALEKFLPLLQAEKFQQNPYGTR